MGVMLEKSGVAETLLETMGRLFGRVGGGLALSVIFVGALLAATTGVVGATVRHDGNYRVTGHAKARLFAESSNGHYRNRRDTRTSHPAEYCTHLISRPDWRTGWAIVRRRSCSRRDPHFPLRRLYLNDCLVEAGNCAAHKGKRATGYGSR